MDKKKIFFFVCFLLLTCVLYSVIRTIVEGEKGKIKRIIFSAKRAVEKEDFLRLSGYVSFDYYDEYGNDRQLLLFLGRAVFDEYEDITLHIKDLKIELKNSASLAQMQVLGRAKKKGEIKDNSMFKYDIIELKVDFKKEEGGWKVIQLEFLEPERLDFIPAA